MKKICPTIETGFTLTELLITIAIVGVLSTMVFVASTGQTAKARDAQRQFDLNQYRIALENFAIKKNGYYPSYTTAVDPSAASSLCSNFLKPTPASYMVSCLQDPRQTEGYSYKYLSNGTGSGNLDALNYILWAKLEKTGNNWWIMCSNGMSKIQQSLPVLADCNS